MFWGETLLRLPNQYQRLLNDFLLPMEVCQQQAGDQRFKFLVNLFVSFSKMFQSVVAGGFLLNVSHELGPCKRVDATWCVNYDNLLIIKICSKSWPFITGFQPA